MPDTVLHRLVSAGDSGDLDAFDEIMWPDVVVHAPLGLSTADRDAEKEVWRAAKTAMPDLRHDIQELFRDGDTLLGRVVVTGTLHGEFAGLRADGRSFQIDQVLIAKVRDGKVYELWEIADTGTLIRQLADS